MQLAYVRWLDASRSADEAALDEMGLFELSEVGFLIRQTETEITLAMEHPDSSARCRLWLTIPKINIREMKTTTLGRAFRLKKS